MAKEHFCKLYCCNSLCRLSTFLDIFTVQIVFCEQGVVRSVNLSEKYSIFTQLPWLGELIVEAEVKTNFLSNK